MQSQSPAEDNDEYSMKRKETHLQAKINKLQEILPHVGMLYSEYEEFSPMLCESIIVPLKSVTLLKLEEMEKKAKLVLGQKNEYDE